MVDSWVQVVQPKGNYFDCSITKNCHRSNGIYEQNDFRGSSRYEQMINDPNFTAKTHYFAKRLEELRQLHEIYRNLAKQAPRGRNSVHSPIKQLPQLSEDDDYAHDESSASESVDEVDSKLSSRSTDGKDGKINTLASLKFTGNFDFDWKSLLPEELDLQSDYGDTKIEGDESSSEISKETNDPLYDIQSDIMPYLP
ncbi:hypothetical protein Avbf_01253, partial [Armadillidium vulgare]